MGRRGPPRKSRAQKALHGTLRRDRDSPGPENVQRGTPEKPDNLPPVADRFWEYFADRLDSAGLMSPNFWPNFEILCRQWAEISDLEETLEESGRTYKTNTGFLRPHPAVKLLGEARRAFLSNAAAFGLDPASLQRLNPLPASEAEDSDAQFLFHFPGPRLLKPESTTRKKVTQG